MFGAFYGNMCSTMGLSFVVIANGNQFIKLQRNSYLKLTPLNVIGSSLQPEFPPWFSGYF